MKYRKKPVVVEVVKWTNETLLKKVPDFFLTAKANGIVYEEGDDLKIKTLEGLMTAKKGDYIIQGVEGEIYSCKPDIFLKTYESVETPEPTKKDSYEESLALQSLREAGLNVINRGALPKKHITAEELQQKLMQKLYEQIEQQSYPKNKRIW